MVEVIRWRTDDCLVSASHFQRTNWRFTTKISWVEDPQRPCYSAAVFAFLRANGENPCTYQHRKPWSANIDRDTDPNTLVDGFRSALYIEYVAISSTRQPCNHLGLPLPCHIYRRSVNLFHWQTSGSTTFSGMRNSIRSMLLLPNCLCWPHRCGSSINVASVSVCSREYALLTLNSHRRGDL